MTEVFPRENQGSRFTRLKLCFYVKGLWFPRHVIGSMLFKHICKIILLVESTFKQIIASFPNTSLLTFEFF